MILKGNRKAISLWGSSALACRPGAFVGVRLFQINLVNYGRIKQKKTTCLFRLAGDSVILTWFQRLVAVHVTCIGYEQYTSSGGGDCCCCSIMRENSSSAFLGFTKTLVPKRRFRLPKRDSFICLFNGKRINIICVFMIVKNYRDITSAA